MPWGQKLMTNQVPIKDLTPLAIGSHVPGPLSNQGRNQTKHRREANYARGTRDFVINVISFRENLLREGMPNAPNICWLACGHNSCMDRFLASAMMDLSSVSFIGFNVHVDATDYVD